MKHIIALRGKGNIGKSTTIDLLRDKLLSVGFNEINGNYGKYRDFWCVFDQNGKRFGITSWGDNCKILRHKIDILNAAGCKIIVCACRSWGDTNSLIENKLGFNYEFVDKIPSPISKQNDSNKIYAEEIWKKIELLL